MTVPLTFSLAKNSENRKRWVEYYSNLSDTDKRRIMEGKSEKLPEQKYPNELGMSDEEIEEGWRFLVEYHRKRDEEKLREAQDSANGPTEPA